MEGGGHIILSAHFNTQELCRFGRVSEPPYALLFLICAVGITTPVGLSRHAVNASQLEGPACGGRVLFSRDPAGLTRFLLHPAQGTRLWVPPSTSTTCSQARLLSS